MIYPIRKIAAVIFGSLLFIFPAFTFADTPSVSGLTMSPQALGNDLSGLLSWSGTGSSYRVNFNCATGVTINAGGSAITCGTRTAVSGTTLATTITNVTGVTQQISATVYPKDSGGTDYDPGAMTTTFTVTTSAQPITDFSVSTTSIASGDTITLTWKGVDTTGANLRFDCNDAIQLKGTSPATTLTLPCNAPAFSPAFAQSGSASVQATNTGTSDATVRVSIMPVIATNAYDLTHALSATFIVRAKVAPPTPSATSFTASATTVTPGQPIMLSWTTANAAGANLQMQCGQHLSVSLISGSSTTPLQCSSLVFQQPLAVSGSSTISINNTGAFPENAVLTLLPQAQDGTYISPSAITKQITVFPQGTNLPATPVVASPATTTTPSANTTQAKKYVFSTYLTRGSKGAAVAALQTLLAADPTLYPEGSITNFYGPATMRAVQRFQVKYNIAHPGEVGYGSVGPKTRVKLNASL